MSTNASKGQPKTAKDILSEQDIKTVVEKALGSKYKLLEYHVKSFSEDKLGFLGSHNNLIVTVRKDGSVDKETHTYFLKCVPYENEQQAFLIEDSNAFYKETNFFRHVMPKLLRELKDVSWVAQCYLVKDDCLVFENLMAKNFSVRDKHPGVEALRAALPSLAKFHAASILAEKRLGKTFLELHPDIMQESMFTRGGQFHIWYDTSMDGIIGIAKHWGIRHDHIRAIADRIYDLVKPDKTMLNVINHGDTKSFNIMFNDSKPPKTMLIDYQLVRYAPAMVDVCQFMYHNTRRAVREATLEDFLKLYHKVLCETLKESDPNMPVPSYSRLRQEYEKVSLVGVITTCLYAPVHFLGEKRAAELTKDSDGFTKFLFKERLGFLLSEMEINPDYKDILTEVVKELVEMADKLTV